MSYEPVADGELAAVVTYLEMRARPAGEVPHDTLQLRRFDIPTAEQYRALFRRVGAPWLWFSRLVMPDDELEAIVQHPDVELYEVAAV
ncbi:MAG TPA: GNAT family N-acetyltransferase, partial [Sphingomicrobium sp.]